jgi:hypothetical protein
MTLDFGGTSIPTFIQWYSENSHEKRQFGEVEYTHDEAVAVYSLLLENGFFK